MSLQIREFDWNRDVEGWVAMRNLAWVKDPEHIPATVEDLRKDERSPWSKDVARFVAELDSRLVGGVMTEIDVKRTDRKAFMFGLGVIPEARRKGAATALARQAMQYLAGKGMERVESPVLTLMPGGTELLTRLGFVPVRWFSRMWRSLGEVPGDLGKRVGLALLDESETSITLLVRLNNEAFSEHYNYRPTTVEEMSYMLSRLRQDKVESKAIVARVGGELAGFLGFGIDPREIAQRGKKVGWLYQLGVLKPFRGKGVATSLIIAAMNWLKSKGMVEVELNVDDTNPTRAIRLYERLGFTVARKIVHFLRRLDR